MQEKDQKFISLKESIDRSDKILKKQMDENQNLKRQLLDKPRVAAASFIEKPAQMPAKRDLAQMRA